MMQKMWTNMIDQFETHLFPREDIVAAPKPLDAEARAGVAVRSVEASVDEATGIARRLMARMSRCLPNYSDAGDKAVSTVRILRHASTCWHHGDMVGVISDVCRSFSTPEDVIALKGAACEDFSRYSAPEDFDVDKALTSMSKTLSWFAVSGEFDEEMFEDVKDNAVLVIVTALDHLTIGVNESGYKLMPA